MKIYLNFIMKQMQTWFIDLITSASCTSCVYWSMFLFIIMFLSVTKLYVLNKCRICNIYTIVL